MTLHKLNFALKGGRGSGDWGHVGRAGKRGGSGGGGGKGKSRRGRRSREAKDKLRGFDKKLVIDSLHILPGSSNIRIDGDDVKFENAAGRTITMSGGKRRLEEATKIPLPEPTKERELEEVKKPDMPKLSMTNMIIDNDILKDKEFPDNYKIDVGSPFGLDKAMIDDLANKSGTSKDFVHNLILTWNDTTKFEEKSNIIKASVDEFGSKLSKYEKRKARGARYANQNVDSERTVLRSMYDKTQNKLKDLGITHVVVFRGLNNVPGKPGDIADYRSNSIESWSTDEETPAKFGGTVIKAKIPIDRILSFGSTGFGAAMESEIVILGSGNKDKVMIVEPLEN